MRAAFLFIAILVLGSGCHVPEARSMRGRPLETPTLPEDVQARREADLRHARTIYSVHPSDEEAIIWLGRRTAYLGRYREAVDIYTNGLKTFPESYRLLRHRGHRYITLRKLDAAIDDLQRADELSRDQPDAIEPDGMPNAAGKPRSTTKGNILYHLGLAHYLQGEFVESMIDFQRCLQLATNDDMRVASAYWLYLSACRCEDKAIADHALAIATPKMDLLENHAYRALLLSFQDLDAGETVDSQLDEGVDEATSGYGLGMKQLLNGETDLSRAQFEVIIAETNWAAFGHIAAEAELARLDQKD